MLLETSGHRLAFDRTVEEPFKLQRKLTKQRNPQVSGWSTDTLRKARLDMVKKEKRFKMSWKSDEQEGNLDWIYGQKRTKCFGTDQFGYWQGLTLMFPQGQECDCVRKRTGDWFPLLSASGAGAAWTLQVVPLPQGAETRFTITVTRRSCRVSSRPLQWFYSPRCFGFPVYIKVTFFKTLCLHYTILY